jgi:transposase
MIEPDRRKAIYYLHHEGTSARKIARDFGISRNTVKNIIAQEGESKSPDAVRKDVIEVDEEQLKKLYVRCDGWMERVHELLIEEEGIEIAYSTLTRKIRELGLRRSVKPRCDKVADEAGAEMQHDTSPFDVLIGDKKIRLQASVLYYRYSKIRYLKFYRSFKRFNMKCFFHEALCYWNYCAPVCIIDNTNLARLRGTGKQALITPEMEQFGQRYGFEFKCHALGHANRKAGNERSFYTLESNFFPGRCFSSMDDLNQQAFDWATKKMSLRPVSKTGLIPAQAFDYEKTYLKRIPAFVTPPYLTHEREIDQYGFIAFGGNFYWVPGKGRYTVTVLQYSDQLKLYRARKLLQEYELPESDVKNKRISPPGQPEPVHQPKYRKKPTEQEEKKLRAISEAVDAYLTFSLRGKGKAKHTFIRSLFRLYQKLALPVFLDTVQRSLKYRITDISAVERIALLQLVDSGYEIPTIDSDLQLQENKAYLEGALTDEVDLSIYDQFTGDVHDG